ncbi:MAG: TonB-dependent receptor [Paracoccaceae bacterium]
MTMPDRTARQRRLFSTVTILALSATPAVAQDTGEGFFQMLGRIILGTGTARVAIDTPQAVTALEQEDLDRIQAQTIGDVLAGVPGAQAAGASARALGQAFNIRGIGNSEQTASEDRIKVTVDGAPKFFEAYRMGSFFGDLDLFKRVEILRGPASSTLYGSGTLGGVVAFTTKDASDFLAEGETIALRFKGSLASNGGGLGGGVIYAHRAGNAEFLAALNRSQGDEQDDGAGTALPGTAFETTSALVKGKWTAGDQDVTLAFSRTDTDLDDSPVAQTGGAALPGFGTADIHSVDDTLTATWHKGFSDSDLLDLTVQLSYTDTDVSKRDFSFGFMCAPGRTAVLCDSDTAYSTTTLKVENVADLSSGAWQNYLTLGLQLSRQDRKATSSVGALSFHPEGTDTRLGLYAQGEFTWNDRLTLIPGLRVDFGDRQPTAATIAGGATAVSDTAVSAKLSAMYEIDDRFALFGTLARTERMPTLDELYTIENGQLASLNLDKEEADSVELGLTFQQDDLWSEGDSLALKTTVFHNDLTNLIISNAAAGPGAARYANVRDAEIWGAELEASYDAERWFGSLAWSSIRSKDGETGLQLQDTPAQNLALTLGVKFPDQGLVLGWKAYYFDDIVNYTTGTTAVNTTTSGDHYHTHDLFVTWRPDTGALAGLDVNLTVENVFDADYRNNLALDRAAGVNAKLSIGKTMTW